MPTRQGLARPSTNRYTAGSEGSAFHLAFHRVTLTSIAPMQHLVLWLVRIITVSVIGLLSPTFAIAVILEHPIQTDRPRDSACDLSKPFPYQITDVDDLTNWCEKAWGKQNDLDDELSYLLQTAHLGDTMIRQGPQIALRLLHPEFVRRLASAIREGRRAGLTQVGFFPPTVRPFSESEDFLTNSPPFTPMDWRLI
jgi:hypothetical protein